MQLAAGRLRVQADWACRRTGPLAWIVAYHRDRTSAKLGLLVLPSAGRQISKVATLAMP